MDDITKPLSDEILRKQTELDALKAELDRVTKAHAAFPDLKRHVGRWGKIAYYSKTINAMAINFDNRHNCGCCRDSPLEIWPFADTEFGRIYSDPPMFAIGEKDYGYTCGSRLNFGWEDRLLAAGLSQALIDHIAQRFTQVLEEDDNNTQEDD